MPTHPELLSSAEYPELPYPPAVTRRFPASLPAADDAVLMPPFSRASLSGKALSIAPSAASLSAEAMLAAGAAPLTSAAAEPPGTELRRELAEEVAGRLESMASDLRRLGFHALLEPRSEREPIDVVLASVIAGFLARR